MFPWHYIYIYTFYNNNNNNNNYYYYYYYYYYYSLEFSTSALGDGFH